MNVIPIEVSCKKNTYSVNIENQCAFSSPWNHSIEALWVPGRRKKEILLRDLVWYAPFSTSRRLISQQRMRLNHNSFLVPHYIFFFCQAESSISCRARCCGVDWSNKSTHLSFLKTLICLQISLIWLYIYPCKAFLNWNPIQNNMGQYL